MPVVEEIGPLRAVVHDRAAFVELPTRAARQRVHLAGGDDGRLRFGLVLAVGDRPLDVSIQPGLLDRLTRATATEAGGGGALVHRFATWIAGRSAAWGAWSPAPSGSIDLVGVVGGGSFPLLGQLYDDGAAPVREVPRWAAPAVAHTTLPTAARRAFGAVATRPVARALAASLAPANRGGRVGFAGLGLGLVGAPVLEPDELVAVLVRAPGNRTRITGDDLGRGRAAVRAWGRAPTARLLTDAAASPDRTRRLLDAFQLWEYVGPHFGVRVPLRVDDLHRALVARLPVDPGPRVVPPRPAPPAPRAAEPPERPRPAPDVGRRPAPRVRARRGEPVPAPPRVPVRALAPVDDGAQPPETAIPIDPALRALDGMDVGDLRLVFPRTVRELATWGARLGNCLGTYGDSARTGRSRLVGVFDGARLAYCVELAPDGHIRQFLGARNRAPTPAHADAVLDALADVLRR